MYSSEQLVNPPSLHVIKPVLYVTITFSCIKYYVIQWVDWGSTNKQWIVIIKDVYSTPASVTCRPLHVRFALSGTYPLHTCPLYHPFLHIDYSLLGFLSNNMQFISLCELCNFTILQSQCRHDLLQSLSCLPNMILNSCVNCYSFLPRQCPVFVFIFTITLIIR